MSDNIILKYDNTEDSWIVMVGNQGEVLWKSSAVWQDRQRMAAAGKVG